MIIEDIYFEKEDILKKFYGNNIGNILTRATIKIFSDETKQQKEIGYEISNELKKSIEKNTFNFLKNKAK